MNRVQSQYKFSDLTNKEARAGEWYDGVWQNVGKCVFCDLKKRYVIKKMNGMVLTTNLYPYIDGHLMIIPKRHITHIKELSKKEWETIRILHYVCKKMLRKLFGIKSLWLLYREGKTGDTSEKTVEHLHIHLLPYKQNLVQWNYQEINRTPFEVACEFKKNQEFFEKYIKRYRTKYK